MSDKLTDYPRDLIGYAGKPPHPRWPGEARVALQFVVNYEEGGENCVLHGDTHSETFLSDIIGAQAFSDRHMSMESLYEYGSRAGFWRIYNAFTERKIPATVFAVTTALEKNHDALNAMIDAGWELASHGLKWISYQDMPEEEEAEQIARSLKLHQELTGNEECGWYTGRTSPNTLKLVAQRNEILYCADSYADDLPYYDTHNGNPLLMVPYTLDANDMRFATAQGFHNADQFFHYLKDAFDVLYEEGKTAPKMMSVGLHCRLIGRPARFAGLLRFLDYVQSKQRVWICTREQIARHWLSHFPFNEEAR